MLKTGITGKFQNYKTTRSRGNTLREAALRLHELSLPQNQGFGYCLHKSFTVWASPLSPISSFTPRIHFQKTHFLRVVKSLRNDRGMS
ncbi:hypothetical protein [Nostoc sp.]|uniref:hypothetical protein n=1 Tax=Nostoc sp. TaxID=1180 RepID=UPI002FF69D3C